MSWAVDDVWMCPRLLVELVEVGSRELARLHVSFNNLPLQLRLVAEYSIKHRSVALDVHFLHLLHDLCLFPLWHPAKTHSCNVKHSIVLHHVPHFTA